MTRTPEERQHDAELGELFAEHAKGMFTPHDVMPQPQRTLENNMPPLAPGQMTAAELMQAIREDSNR